MASHLSLSLLGGFGGIEAIDTEFPYRVPIVDSSAIAVPLFAETNKHKEFGGTHPGVRPVCPGDTSHLSRDIDLHITQAQMSQMSLGRPEFVPGTPPGHPDRQIPLCDFSL